MTGGGDNVLVSPPPPPLRSWNATNKFPLRLRRQSIHNINAVVAAFLSTASDSSNSSLLEQQHPILAVSGTIAEHGVGIAVGQYAQVERVFTESEVNLFGCLVSDRNPLHQRWKRHDSDNPAVILAGNHPLVKWNNNNNEDNETKNNEGEREEEKDQYSQILVHGMLVSSLFTCILGTLIPGSVYLKQTLEFQRPVYVGDPVRGKITVLEARPWKRPGLRLTCETTVRLVESDKLCLQGQAEVWLLPPPPQSK